MEREYEALICAKAAEAIYGTPTDLVGDATSKAAMEALGFSNFLWIDLPTMIRDVCAFVATSESHHVLVFRGTKTPQDWLTDLACASVRFEMVFAGGSPMGEIHSGFGHCLADGLERIILPLSHRERTKPLLITGHSLGGGLAALAGACFSVLAAPVPPVSAIYTFGQPRIGLHAFCDEYKGRLGGKLVRFVNHQDVVPRVPLRAWGYGDVGTMIHFDSWGKPSLQSEEWQGFIARAFQSIGEAAEMTGHMRADVGDHSKTGYRRLIENNQGALAAILGEGANGN